MDHEGVALPRERRLQRHGERREVPDSLDAALSGAGAAMCRESREAERAKVCENTRPVFTVMRFVCVRG